MTSEKREPWPWRTVVESVLLGALMGLFFRHPPALFLDEHGSLGKLALTVSLSLTMSSGLIVSFISDRWDVTGVVATTLLALVSAFFAFAFL